MLRIRQLVGAFGALLVSWAGHANAATHDAQTAKPDDGLGASYGAPKSGAMMLAQDNRMAADRMGRVAETGHANSGPTHHANVPGHANFEMKFADPATRLTAAQVQNMESSLDRTRVAETGHANSGPTQHANVPGHANFEMKFANPATRLTSSQVEGVKSRLVSARGAAAAHANSGPTSHSNVPGHADFSDRNTVNQSVNGMRGPGALAGAHANSGPTSHSNVPGHANFTKTFSDPAARFTATEVRGMEGNLNNVREASGAHANSGPTSHSNVPGHANFSMRFSDPAARLSVAQVQQIQRGMAPGQ